MKVVITGGSGFIGDRLCRHLVAHPHLVGSDGKQAEVEEIILFDIGLPDHKIDDPRVRYVTGDLCDEDLIAEMVGDADSVFHFASVVSGGAEADLQLGLRVNLDGTRLLLDLLAKNKRRTKLLFASSCAVYSQVQGAITDHTIPAPKSSYGVQKLCSELLIGDYSRRGLVDGRSMRFPTVAVRPGKANLANSSFISNVIREPLMGRDVVCQVSDDVDITIMSPSYLLDAIIRIHDLAEEKVGWPRAYLFPALKVNVREMLQALRELAGEEIANKVSFAPDPAIEAMVRTWPMDIEAQRAEQIGIRANDNARQIVAEFIADMKT